MNKIRLKTFSRLTIIFVLAVTVSGGVLTYLSIQNITNVKELTEKKVIEEENAIADLVIENFQNKLNSITSEFSDVNATLENNDLTAVKFSDTIEFIDNPFIINLRGNFLWPNFITDYNNAEEEAYSTNFTESYKTAEQYEFINQSYPDALNYFKRSLRIASGKSDSAKSLNAIARIYVKSKNIDQAITYYELLISNCYSVTDKDGLLYINYAIPQLVKISEATNERRILDMLQLVLFGMESGKIALNYSTDDILDIISKWINENLSVTQEEIKTIKKSIDKIRKRTSFLLLNHNEIEAFISKEKNTDIIPLVSDFYAKKVSQAGNHDALVISKGLISDHVIGFTIDLNQLKEYSLNILPSSSFRFKYKTSVIITDSIPNYSNDELITISELSPLIPDYYLVIKLQNENLAKDYIFRTSWIYGIAIALLLGGLILGIVLIIRDIYREKRLSDLKSDFVSNVTHELKTPLTSIYMFAESILLNRIKSKSERDEYLEIILKETERLKRLINNILDFSKIEKGKLDYSFKEVNISDIVLAALNNLDYWIIEKKFLIETQIEPNIFGLADPDALKQSIINLLSNAIKYSQERKDIYIRLWKNKELIYIEIEDKGIGIPEDQINLIFDKFYRVENKNDNSGTGLGLTVVKEIVEAHKGKIMVESEISRGSKFTIVLNTK